mmetsp:Transcript_67622/g.175614  ORF Transcript_67622/g.175614 Transcript_67622/m.175614 type:complete len:249 (+) Transcript_67622:63-809(+)
MAGTSDITTMPELFSKLTERGQQLLMSEQIAKASIDEVKGQVNTAAADMMELKRRLEQEYKVYLAQNEKNLRETALVCHQRVRQAESERRAAQAMAAQVLMRQKAEEDRIATLQLQIQNLESHLKFRTDAGKTELASLNRMMDTRVRRVDAQSESRVVGMTQHARDLERKCRGALREVEGEMQEQLAAAHLRAEGRTRWKELCRLADGWLDAEMSESTYKTVKAELLDLWKVQTTSHMPRRSPMPWMH